MKVRKGIPLSKDVFERVIEMETESIVLSHEKPKYKRKEIVYIKEPVFIVSNSVTQTATYEYDCGREMIEKLKQENYQYQHARDMQMKWARFYLKILDYKRLEDNKIKYLFKIVE